MNYEYKNTGIEWLGEIPRHWKFDRLRDNCVINDKALGNRTPNETIINYLDISNVDSKGIVDFEEIRELIFEEAPSRARRITQKFDTVISSVRTNLQAVAYLDFEKENLICSTGFFVCRPIHQSKLDNKFLYYFLLTEYSKDYFFSRSVGVSYPAIDDYKFGSINLPFPPLPEQKAIADYLDKACKRIDNIIEIKQKQLDALASNQSSVLFDILTRGLDKNIDFVNPEINWMAKMPKHWKKKRIKDVVSLRSGDSITSTDINDLDEFPVYGGNGFRGFTDKYTHVGEFALIGRQGALCGNINYASGKFWASEHAVVATPINTCSTLWIGELLRIMDLNQYSNAAAQPGLAVERIKQLYLPVPPFSEQIKLSDFIKDFKTRNKKLEENITKQINTLQTYRKSLIHECVTGKKQVWEGEIEK
jgi:type I restriction enzyme S subunit